MNVVIGIATRGCDIHYELVLFLLKQKADVLFAKSSASAAFGQNLIFDTFYKNSYEYLMIIDSDVSPVNGVISKLIEADKDIVTAPVWMYDPFTNDIHLNVHLTLNKSDRVYTLGKGLQRIYYSSFSCILIKRKVIEEFVTRGEPFVFSNTVKSEGDKLFSDNIFFDKARSFGFKAFVNWDVKGTVHHRSVDLSSAVLEQYMRKRYLEVELEAELEA